MGFPIKISIITVSYNSLRFLDDYFASVERQDFRDLEIILVDNGSTDGSVELVNSLTRNKPIIKLIENKKNLGFAGGNNIGAKKATGKYLFFLNPDTRLEKDCLKNLWEKAENIKDKDFILIPRQKNYKTGGFLLDGVCVDIFGYPYKIFNTDKPKMTKPLFFCDGAALFLPKRTFTKLGMFDEKLFMFNEDIDLSWKAHLLDIPLINAPEAIVYHFSGGSMRGGIRRERIYETTYFRRYMGERNAIRNILKNYSIFTLLWLLPIYSIINLVEMVVFLLARKPKVVFQYLRAWWWNIKNLGSTLSKRNFIQKARKISDLEILNKLYFGSGKLNAFLSIKVPEFE